MKTRTTKLISPLGERRTGLGLWAVAFAFTAAMAFTTVPTPLWSLYAQRDHFSSLTVTLVFAAYAVAVAVSLFLAGHLSDSYGRRRVLVPALALNIIAGVVFVTWPALPVFSWLLALGILAAAPALLGDRGRGPRASAQPHPISQ